MTAFSFHLCIDIVIISYILKNMTTQMIFRIDKKLKLAAQRRAKSQGITLSHLYKQATRSFVAGKLDITITALLPEIPNTRTARLFKSSFA